MNPEGPKYDHVKIEKRWQDHWETKKIFRAKTDPKKKKFYSLIEFPFPSGDGLHVGHIRSNTAMDIISHKRRAEGFNVMYPIGWDAFGLPTENYAIKTGIQPAIVTKDKIAVFTKQLKSLGFSFDWSREVNTSDPKYYKWTQWIFLQFLKEGLAYKKKMTINWCPKDLIGLANEEVINGHCERCGTKVEKREKEQWMLAITKYADKLLAGLDEVEYVMPKFIDDKNPHEDGKPTIKRDVAHAIVFDPKNKKYLIIRNKKFNWDTVIIGGIENGETAIETATREVREETGYTDIEFKRLLGGKAEAHYYAKHKGENRIAFAQGVYLELKSDARAPIAEGEDDQNEILWINEADFVPGKMVNSELGLWLERIKDPSKGWPTPLLDWPEFIKQSQRNWIGKSEGAEITFKVVFENNAQPGYIPVFTTRPDTLYGVTYMVMSPEHLWVTLATDDNHKGVLKNVDEVKAYIQEVKGKDDATRTDATAEKTGVELKGVKAVNPATGEEIPIWIADYVLADYGTGAVMAVPAHDERDFEFARKYNLNIRQVIAPYFENTTDLPPKKDKKKEDRENVHAIVKHPTENKFLFIKWKKEGWKSLVTGGIKKGETAVAAARREVLEETGYKNLRHIEVPGSAWQVHSYFFAPHKDVNRYMVARGVFFELENEERTETTDEEKAKHDYVWVDEKEARNFLTYENQKLIWDYMTDSKEALYTGAGKLINSGKFDGEYSDGIKKEITESVKGKWVTKFKLRDWVFSRQRYWGEPIPVVHCEKCGIVPVPEKDLPVKLPKVKNYKPTETGESPLAAISSWVNTKCPNCKGPAQRETDTMPNWAGSSWYYLRYTDPKNAKAFASPENLEYWTPVDWYNGGMEHVTLHLLYSRFWHKFLYDQKLVPTSEPYKKRTAHGLILAQSGEKMSKSKGNVVNPDDIVKTVGADTLRVYEMFMGPFDQAIAWDTNNIAGARRFIERVWKLQEKVIDTKENSSEAIIHKTIKKVSDDIEAMRFNTAISSMMIAVNELEKEEKISKENYQTLVKLLSPFAPHMTEELWQILGNKKTVHLAPWPVFDPQKVMENTVMIAVQVNGKVRADFEAAANATDEELKTTALAMPQIQKWTEGKEPKKVIVIKGRLVNIVI